ncbi:MAG: hypothetical protein PHU65_03000 [Actinomycetota bacterium]|jgi:hypothetical protein|nr:hypothetical protein [Actinomycetota bacterium]
MTLSNGIRKAEFADIFNRKEGKTMAKFFKMVLKMVGFGSTVRW